MEDSNFYSQLLIRGLQAIFIIYTLRSISLQQFKTNLKNLFLRLKFYFKKVYRITAGCKHFKKFVWQELLHIHKVNNWRHGVFEANSYVETFFSITEDTNASYYYILHENYLNCRVDVIKDFAVEITTDIFILAAHFNNLIQNGIVVVNVESRNVQYHAKADTTLLSLYPGVIYSLIKNHFDVSKDVKWAFDKMIAENEEPALIMADFIKMVNEKNNENEEYTE